MTFFPLARETFGLLAQIEQILCQHCLAWSHLSYRIARKIQILPVPHLAAFVCCMVLFLHFFRFLQSYAHTNTYARARLRTQATCDMVWCLYNEAKHGHVAERCWLYTTIGFNSSSCCGYCCYCCYYCCYCVCICVAVGGGHFNLAAPAEQCWW